MTDKPPSYVFPLTTGITTGISFALIILGGWFAVVGMLIDGLYMAFLIYYMGVIIPRQYDFTQAPDRQPVPVPNLLRDGILRGGSVGTIGGIVILLALPFAGQMDYYLNNSEVICIATSLGFFLIGGGWMFILHRRGQLSLYRKYKRRNE